MEIINTRYYIRHTSNSVYLLFPVTPVSLCKNSLEISIPYARLFCAVSSLQMFLKISLLKNVAILKGKRLCLNLSLMKLQAFNIIKKRLQHRRFPVNIAKFLRTSILQNIFHPLFSECLNTQVILFQNI